MRNVSDFVSFVRSLFQKGRHQKRLPMGVPMILPAVFVAQMEPPEQMEEIIAGRREEDRNLPCWNWCGICCVRALLLGLDREAPSLEEMYRVATEKYAAYRDIDGEVIGAYHREFAQFITDEFGLKATAKRNQLTGDIAGEVADGRYVIVSVAPSIRFPAGDEPEQRRGHLVLVHGVEETPGGRIFIITNSSGFQTQGTQFAGRISEERFKQCFSGSGIIVEVPPRT